MIRSARFAVTLLGVLSTTAFLSPTVSQEAAVRAVLFYSPTCQHCHEVINNHLPGIFERFGGAASIFFDRTKPQGQAGFYEITNGRLQILLIDVALPQGQAIYRSWATAHSVPQREWSVPRLVFADSSLVGSFDIPEILPQLIEEGLAAGGVDWPDIAGFNSALAAIPPHAQPTPTDGPLAEDPTFAEEDSRTVETPEEVIPSRALTVAEKFNQDRVGNSLSVVVLLLMVASLVALFVFMRAAPAGERLGVAVPVIAVIGAAVAVYLTYVETSGATAACGPVGDCNTVNQSEYARLFGVLPVGLLGLIGYLAILAAWVVSRLDLGTTSDWAIFSVLGMAVLGTLFSIYLTFLEPFVIGATCIWCLSSAIAITLLMWLSARPGREAWQRLNSVPGDG
jgi:uncharacterized membrane protein